MKLFVCAASAAGVLSFAASASAHAPSLPPVRIQGPDAVPACATAERLTDYLRTRNPKLHERFSGLAGEYRRQGRALGLRWDFAFFQMIVETASLTYRRLDGSPARISPAQNNFAGLGLEDAGEARSYSDVSTGVGAHLRRIAHLSRGEASYTDLAYRWVHDGETYAAAIASVARRFYAIHCDAPEPTLAAAEAAGEHALDPVQAPRRDGRSAPRREPALLAGPVLVREVSYTVAAANPAADVAIEHMFESALAMPADGDVEGTEPIAADQGDPQPRGRPAYAAAHVITMALPRLQPPPKPALDPADEAVRSLVAGRTVLLDTPVGATIPISFSESGAMRGKAGSLGSYLGADNDDGKWWVSGGRLCQRWRIWFERQTQCLTLRKSGQVVHWSSDKGHSGTARIVSAR